MTYPIASHARAVRHVMVRDLVLHAMIGVHPREYAVGQRVRINLDLGVEDSGEERRLAGDEDLAGVVDYERLVIAIRALVGRAHVRLVETLAERIAGLCLRADPRVATARVRVEKIDVFADAAAAGVEIERSRQHGSGPA